MSCTAHQIWLRTALAAAMVAALSGCASNRSYVVLINNADGTVGKVKVAARGGAVTTLDKAQQGTVIGGDAGKTFSVQDSQLNQDFGFALAATPVAPSSFMLYFDYSNAKLTPESLKLIPNITAAINQHPAPDVSIVGHTDTVGDDSYNAKLSMQRAQAVSQLLNLQSKLGNEKVSIEAHGEKHLLIPTPDQTPEPRNRRVEVTVR